ncbi:hypothetical protein ACP2AV_09335 [Aliiroseovarius sp. PTFE2010]|uniref:hypothetical protein n=1 Tax=Aliiroseovarius sp. PTFE2010 TaxID=3417190 RepID=UPI003CF125E8
MSDNHTDSVWPKIILWACIAGAVAFLLLLFMAEYTAVGALLLGALVTILVAILLWIGWYPSGDSVDAVPMAPAPTSTNPDPVATQPTAPAQAPPAQDSTPSSDDARVKAAAAMPPPAAPPAPRAEIKPSKELAGQTELSERKGEWKYEPPAKAAGVSSTMALAETAKELSKPETQDASKPAKKPAAKKPAAEKPARKPVAKDGKPELLEKARAGGPDDLKQIKGIGPKLESVLHEMGIFHFDQIASWRKKEVEWVDNALTGVNKGRPTRDGWVQQAKILAKGGQTEFSKRVTKGGVY